MSFLIEAIKWMTQEEMKIKRPKGFEFSQQKATFVPSTRHS